MKAWKFKPVFDASVVKHAGFVAAHGLWCIAEGDTLTPMLSIYKIDATKRLIRFESDSYESAVEDAKAWANNNEKDILQAVLVFDGYISHTNEKRDVLIIEVLKPFILVFAFPYRPASGEKEFEIYRLKFMRNEVKNADMNLLAEAFFDGLDEHEHGSKIYHDHFSTSQ